MDQAQTVVQRPATGSPQAPRQLNKFADFHVSPRHTVLSCFLDTSRKGKSKKRNSSDATIKPNADVGGLPLWGTLSLSSLPLCLLLPSLHQSCSVPNMFSVFQIGFHCKRIALPVVALVQLLGQKWVMLFICSPWWHLLAPFPCGAGYLCVAPTFTLIANFDLKTPLYGACNCWLRLANNTM